MEGGTEVYIFCSGHSMKPENNKINIGPYPCIIPEKGVNENSIKCETTEAFDVNRRHN